MKRFSFLLSVVLALGSCQTFGFGPESKYTFAVVDPYNDDVVKFSVTGLEIVTRLTTGRQVVGLHVQIVNSSSNPLTIKWADSSIDYNGKSHDVFLSGHYYSDAAHSMPDTRLGPGSQIALIADPAENIPKPQQIQGDIQPIYSKDISCSLSVVMGSESRVYVIRVAVE